MSKSFPCRQHIWLCILLLLTVSVQGQTTYKSLIEITTSKGEVIDLYDGNKIVQPKAGIYSICVRVLNTKTKEMVDSNDYDVIMSTSIGPYIHRITDDCLKPDDINIYTKLTAAKDWLVVRHIKFLTNSDEEVDAEPLKLDGITAK